MGVEGGVRGEGGVGRGGGLPGGATGPGPALSDCGRPRGVPFPDKKRGPTNQYTFGPRPRRILGLGFEDV